MVPSNLRSAFLLFMCGVLTPILAMEGGGQAFKVLETPAAEAAQLDICVICQEHMAISPALLANQYLVESQKDLKELNQQHEQRMQELATICANREIPVPLREQAQAEMAHEEEKHSATLRGAEEIDRYLQVVSTQALGFVVQELHELLPLYMRELAAVIDLPETPESAKESARSEILHYKALLSNIEQYIILQSNNVSNHEQRDTVTQNLLDNSVVESRWMATLKELLIQPILQQNQEILLTCAHRYHRSCLNAFLKSQGIVSEEPVLACPTCRGQLNGKDLLGLTLELTADDIFSFFTTELINQLTHERIAFIRTHIQALLDTPQTNTDIELITTYSSDEVRELINKLQLLLKFLSLDSVRTGDFQQLAAQVLPMYTKEYLHEAIFAAIDHFGIAEGDIDELARAMTLQPGGALVLQLAAPSMVAFKKLLRIPRPQLREDRNNPLITEAQRINRRALTACIIRLGLPSLLALINKIGTTDEQTPFIRIITPYIALQACSYYFRRDNMIPYLERLMKALFPLQVDNLPQTADTLAQMFFSGDIVNRIPETLRAITAQNPQLQERTRTALLQYVDHQQEHVDRVRNEISPWRVRLDRGHVVLIGFLFASILLNLYL